MFDYIETMHMGLKQTEAIRVILLRNDWQIVIKKSDKIWNDCDGKLLVVEHENGKRALVNMDHISLVCIINSGRTFYE